MGKAQRLSKAIRRLKGRMKIRHCTKRVEQDNIRKRRVIRNNNIIQSKLDGDTVTVKGVWTTEANAELNEELNSKKHYIGLTGKNIRVGSNEAIQALYSLTLLLDDSKHEKPQF